MGHREAKYQVSGPPATTALPASALGVLPPWAGLGSHPTIRSMIHIGSVQRAAEPVPPLDKRWRSGEGPSRPDRPGPFDPLPPKHGPVWPRPPRASVSRRRTGSPEAGPLAQGKSCRPEFTGIQDAAASMQD